MWGVGIDFGTTNSSAVLYDGERFVDLVGVMPTALYLDRALHGTVGQPAVDAYLRQNTGRVVELSREEVGDVTITVSEGDDIRGREGGTVTTSVRVHAYTDRDMPGRLFRSLKRWLGDASLGRVRVFDARYRIVALCTPILVHVREHIEAAGAPAEGPHVGRPVRYEGRRAGATDVAVERMLEACRHADLGAPTLYPEPVAAAQSYLRAARDASARTVLAFDFGGGTLDVAVLRARGEDFEVLSSDGVAIGGDAIDRVVLREAVFPELGQRATILRPVGPELRRERFPFERFADGILNWALAYELNRDELRALIVESARSAGPGRHALERLYTLVTRNQAYRVFRAVERAKIELSENERAEIVVDELDLRVPITRDQLERWIAPLSKEVAAVVDRAVAAAGLRHADVDVAVRTGGSAALPAAIRLLEERFPRRVTAHDAFGSIACGLAIASWRRLQSPLLH